MYTSYKKFVSVEPIFHPICSSDLIDDQWLNTLNTIENNKARNLQLCFRLLPLFCQFTREIIKFEFVQLNNSYLFSSQLLSKSQVETQTNVSVEQTIVMASSTFVRSLQLLIDTSNINKLLSADERFQPSDAFIIQNLLQPIEFVRREYLLSSCYLLNRLGNITIDQFYTNCDAMQALLASLFVSFYNQNTFRSLTYFISNISSRPLNLPIIFP